MKLGKDGFTLPELLLSAAILVFCISGMLLLFVNGSFLNNANRNLSVAASHAQFVAEEIKNTDFSTLQADINNGLWNWDLAQINAKGLSTLPGESINTSVSGADLLDITITILWQDRASINRSFVLETIIASP